MHLPDTITVTRRQYVTGILCALLLAVAAVLTSCGIGKATEPFRDAPVSGQNDQPAAEVFMPDGFSNMAVKCVAPGFLGASAYHGDGNRAAIALVPDPRCK